MGSTPLLFSGPERQKARDERQEAAESRDDQDHNQSALMEKTGVQKESTQKSTKTDIKG